jgi:hypothetical protein
MPALRVGAMPALVTINAGALYMAGLGLEMPLLETMPTVTPYCFGPAPAGYYTD